MLSTAPRESISPELIEQLSIEVARLRHEIRQEKYSNLIDRPNYDQLRQRLIVKLKQIDELEDRLLNLEEHSRQANSELTALRKQSALGMENLEHANLHLKRVSQIAFHDALTGLANRRLFDRRLRLWLANSKQTPHLFSALIYLDIDRFSSVNDLWGHGAGDTLLRLFAGRLQSNARDSDTIARLGGDEFCILLTNIATTEHEAHQCAAAIAEKLRALLTAPYAMRVLTTERAQREIIHEAAVSLGVVVFSGNSTNAPTLLDQADQAMYCAKQQGGNRVSFYVSSDHENGVMRGAIERRDPST